MFGLETQNINLLDLDRFDVEYRCVLKGMLSLPDSVASCAVYLTMGQLPIAAERDIEVLALLGQHAACPSDLQNITEIVKRNLTIYDIDFPGFSGVARRTAALYGLPDPLQYMEYPWVPKRWRAHVRDTVTSYWNTLLREKVEVCDSLNLLDPSRLTTSSPHPIC